MRKEDGSGAIRPFHLNGGQLRLLMDGMDRNADQESGPADGPSKRQHPRRPYRVGSVRITIDQGGREQVLIVPLRNISQGGLAFLHRCMLHAGTACIVELECGGEDSIKVVGRVVHCRHVNGLVHEIGLKFDSTIRLDWLGPSDADLMLPPSLPLSDADGRPGRPYAKPRPRRLDNGGRPPFNLPSPRAISSVG